MNMGWFVIICVDSEPEPVRTVDDNHRSNAICQLGLSTRDKRPVILGVARNGHGEEARRSSVTLEQRSLSRPTRTGDARAQPTPISRICPINQAYAQSTGSRKRQVNRAYPKQYPPIPALIRNENPPYRRLSGMDPQSPELKVIS